MAHVRVYRNLHNGKLSVQHYLPGRGWRVAHHADDVVLANVTFTVSEAGRARCLREKKKNVHAFIIGDEAPVAVVDRDENRVSYNPYRAGEFLLKLSGAPVHHALAAHVTGDGAIHVEDPHE